MLILTRRISEAFTKGDDVYVTVLGIEGHKARLGDVPRDVAVHR